MLRRCQYDIRLMRWARPLGHADVWMVDSADLSTITYKVMIFHYMHTWFRHYYISRHRRRYFIFSLKQFYANFARARGI